MTSPSPAGSASANSATLDALLNRRRHQSSGDGIQVPADFGLKLIASTLAGIWSLTGLHNSALEFAYCTIGKKVLLDAFQKAGFNDLSPHPDVVGTDPPIDVAEAAISSRVGHP
jgi:hypothetical protein